MIESRHSISLKKQIEEKNYFYLFLLTCHLKQDCQKHKIMENTTNVYSCILAFTPSEFFAKQNEGSHLESHLLKNLSNRQNFFIYTMLLK